MSESNPQPAFIPPVSTFTGPVAELIAQRMLLPPPRPGLLAVLSHYEILRILGGGGMGVVLLARDAQTGREVAVKLVRSDLVTNQHIVHRFLKEAGHLKRLQHTNIVPVLELSDQVDNPYFVMPFFEKGSLANRIQPGRPLDTETILNVATQLAEGLSFAHRSGIIHRDLKPANILLGNNGQVCLADFGLARTVFNDTIVDVESRHLEGTAPYMSPAVAAGNAEDTRCDIYSFGALLYEMLTGQPPYQGRGTKEILDQILAGPPKPILSVNPAADRGLVAVAERALARELRDRYAEMRDVLNDLHRIKDGKQPLGRHGGASAWRPFVAVPVVVAVLVIGLGVWLFSRERGPVKPAQPAVTAPPAPVAVKPVVNSPAVVAPVNPPVPKPSSVVQPVAVPPAPRFMTVAGQPGIAGTADGLGSQAQFRLPNSVALDPSGIVYVADTANHTIRKIARDGTVTTLAGLPGVHGTADGVGNQARFWAPFGIAIDNVGNLYVADTANNTIRKMTPAGIVSTLAGLPGEAGSRDGIGALARFRNPWGLVVDHLGNIIVADMSNDTIRRITPTGTVTTVAGLPGIAGHMDGLGAIARFSNPFAVAVDSADNIYVSDSANDTIRKITLDGEVSTLAGLAGVAGLTDGTREYARFWNPQGLVVDAAGNVYVADTGNNAIRKITPMGVVTTLPDVPAATGATNGLSGPGGLTLDNAGNLYVADSNHHCIRKIVIAH